MHLRTAVPLIAAIMLTLGFASQAPAAPAATQPALSPADAALLQQLKSRVWRDRQSAQASLQRRADRGDLDGAEASARAMLAAATVPEVRVRLRAVLDRIADDRLMQPTLITMHVHDAPAKAVYEELFRQAGAPLIAVQPDLLAKDQTRLTIDADRMPFWEVAAVLDVQSRVQLTECNTCQLQLAVNSAEANEPRTRTGPFRFMLKQSLEFSGDGGSSASVAGQTFVLAFDCLAEPGRRVTAVANQITVQEAVDDHGNSLVPDKPVDGMVGAYVSLGAVLQHPAKNAGTRLVRFRGTAVITVETARVRVEFPVSPAALPMKFALEYTSATRSLLVPIAFDEVNLSSLPTGTVGAVDGDGGILLPSDDIEGQ